MVDGLKQRPSGLAVTLSSLNPPLHLWQVHFLLVRWWPFLVADENPFSIVKPRNAFEWGQIV